MKTTNETTNANQPQEQSSAKPDERIRVLAINASPNREKGNTALILTPFLEGMKEAGAEVDIVYTEDLSIQPCTGCYTCWFGTPGTCIHNDDMATWLLPAIAEADILVMATPVYVWGVTGPMKTLMDRMIPLVQPFFEEHEGKMRHLSGPLHRAQQTVLVSNCGFWEMDNFDPLLAQFETRGAHGNSPFAGALLRPHGPVFKKMLEMGAPVNDVLDAARQAGHQLVREGVLDPALLATVSRPLLTKEDYMMNSNQAFVETLKHSP